MSPGHAKRRGPAGFALAALAAFSITGCGGDGVAGSPKGGGDDFDRDDITVTVAECASEKRPTVTLKVTANTSPEDRTYYVGVEFLDSDGNVVDSLDKTLDPQSDSGAEEISEKLEFSMSESDKADEVASCKVTHAF
jgi:hypothetical protein